eukprot:403369084
MSSLRTLSEKKVTDIQQHQMFLIPKNIQSRQTSVPYRNHNIITETIETSKSLSKHDMSLQVPDQRQTSLLKIRNKLANQIASSKTLLFRKETQKFTLRKLNNPDIINEVVLLSQQQSAINNHGLQNEDQRVLIKQPTISFNKLPPRPSMTMIQKQGTKVTKTTQNPIRRVSKIVDKSILLKNTQIDKEKLARTLDHLQKDFFSCPLVDEPDPQEKQLLVFQQKEIENYLKQEKEKKEQVKKLTLELEQIERQLYNLQDSQKNGGSPSLGQKLQMAQFNALIKKISEQLLTKTQSKTLSNLRKIKSQMTVKHQFSNPEIKALQNNDIEQGNLAFTLMSPKDYATKDIEMDHNLKHKEKSMTLKNELVDFPSQEEQFQVYKDKIKEIMLNSNFRNKIDDKNKKGDIQKKQLFIKTLIFAVNEMKQMKLTPEMIITGQVFPKVPFQKGQLSRDFFFAVKIGDIDSIEQMLKKDRFLVHEYDHANQSALHWAAKRNKSAIVKLLVKIGARLNQRDMGGRTPLFLAAKYNNLQAVKVLLAKKANPLIPTQSLVTPIMIAENHKIRGFIAKAVLLHICMPLINVRRRKAVWENEGLLYFNSPDNAFISDFS